MIDKYLWNYLFHTVEKLQYNFITNFQFCFFYVLFFSMVLLIWHKFMFLLIRQGIPEIYIEGKIRFSIKKNYNFNKKDYYFTGLHNLIINYFRIYNLYSKHGNIDIIGHVQKLAIKVLGVYVSLCKLSKYNILKGYINNVFSHT